MISIKIKVKFQEQEYSEATVQIKQHCTSKIRVTDVLCDFSHDYTSRKITNCSGGAEKVPLTLKEYMQYRWTSS